MKPSRIQALFLTAVVLAGTAGLAGCTKDHGLPTVGSPSTSAGSDLEVSAKKYYDCMTGAGVKVDLAKNSRGQLTIVRFLGAETVMWRAADGVNRVTSASKDPNKQQAIDNFYASTDRSLALIIDGVDHSEAYAKCLAESGYEEQTAAESMQVDPAETQLQVQGNNKWAACVRENGWPDVRDSTVGTDPSKLPVVVLPGSITEDQLRQLLTVCPNFDPEQEDRLREWWNTSTSAGYPDGYLPAPNIDLDIPAWSSASDPNWVPNQQEKAELERAGRLFDILTKKMNDYYGHLSGAARDASNRWIRAYACRRVCANSILMHIDEPFLITTR